MLSFQDQYQLAQSLSQDFTTGGKTLFKQLINNFQRELETEIGSFVTHKQTTFDSVNGVLPGQTYIYPLPPNFIRLESLWTNVGNTTYQGTEVFNEDEWRQYFFSNVSTKSNFLSRTRVRKDTLEVFPIPASSNTFNMLYEARSNDLSQDDYIAGTISSLTTTTGVTTIIGSGTVWDATMVGRYIQLAGDTQWYPIYTRASNINITLKTPYIGALTSFSGISYKIGELPPTPGDTHVIPVYGALALYFSGPKKDTTFLKTYKTLYDDGLARAKGTYSNPYSKQVITPSARQLRAGLSRNPNYYPSNIGP